MHHPFSWLEMLRRHQFVRKYHGSTGKGTLAMDECLELADRFHTQIPKVRTLKAFSRLLSIGSNTSFGSNHVY